MSNETLRAAAVEALEELKRVRPQNQSPFWFRVTKNLQDALDQQPAASGEPVTLADVLDALNLFNRPKPSEDDGPWEGGHFIRVDHLPDFINVIAAAWFAPQPAPALVPLPTVDEFAQCIRWINGNNKMGAAALADALLHWLEHRAAAPDAPTDQSHPQR